MGGSSDKKETKIRSKHHNKDDSSSSSGLEIKNRSRCRKRSKSSSSRSSSSSVDRKKQKCSKKKKSKHKRKRSASTSSSTSSSSSSDSDERRRRKEKKKAKKLKKKLKKEKRKEAKKARNVQISEPVEDCNDVPLALMDKSRAMAPMTKEEWEKKQSVIRKVYDEETGRHRLIKGDGEVIEEIVSRERHKDINRQATTGDGNYFQAKLASNLNSR